MTATSEDQTETNDPTTDWPARVAALAAIGGPGAGEHDRTGEIPTAAFDELRTVGITAALVPSEFGGGGATHVEMGRILRDIGRVDPAVALTLSMHTHLVAAQVWRHNQGLDASAVFAKVADGAFLISTGASDWVGSNGSAEQVDGGYRVSGRKSPASGCEVGDVLVSSIRWEDSPDGPQVLHFSVPFTSEGVSIEQTWDTMGLRATGSHTVVLESVFVPDGAVALARPADVWHPIWSTVLGAAMPLIMAAYVGIADAAVEIALEMVGDREDAPIAAVVGEMVNAHTTGVDVVDAMLASSDNLRFANTEEHASITLSRKSVASGALIDTVRLAMEVTGGRGYTRGSDLERLFRDVHGCQFHPLPRARQLTLTGRVARGLSPIG